MRSERERMRRRERGNGEEGGREVEGWREVYEGDCEKIGEGRERLKLMKK